MFIVFPITSRFDWFTFHQQCRLVYLSPAVSIWFTFHQQCRLVCLSPAVSIGLLFTCSVDWFAFHQQCQIGGDVTPTTPFGELVSMLTNSICCPANPPSVTGGSALVTCGPVHSVSRTCARHAQLPLSMDLFEPLADQWKQEQPMVSRDAVDCGQCGGNGPVKICLHSSSALTPCHRPAASINKMQPVLPPNCPRPKVKVVAPPSVPKGEHCV